MTAPAEKFLNPSAVGAFSVAAVTIAASIPILAVRIAAFVTAPVIPGVRHSVRADRWRGLLTFLSLEHGDRQHPLACLRRGNP